MDRAASSERLSAADASNVVIDASDQVNAFLMAGLLAPGGFVTAAGVADMDVLRSGIADRLAEDRPSLRRLSRRVGRDGRLLVWEPCAPDLTQHVREVAAVDGKDGLAGLCATLMTTPLPIDRPLWEVLVVPGAWAQGPGIVVRFHHALSDGVGAVGLVDGLLGHGEAVPSVSRRETRTAPRNRLRSLLTGIIRVTSMFRTAVPPTVLLGRIGARRGAAFVEVELEGISRGAKAAGGTVNDALLAAVAGAVEDALVAAGQPVPPVLPASVPVALAERGRSGNAVGVMLVELPTGERDPAVRVARIAALSQKGKSEARSQGTFEATRTRWGSRLFAWFARHQHFIALFVTNVRGPREQLVLVGAPLEMAWPLTPIQGNVRLGVSALSYRGRLGCAIHVDADATSAAVWRSACTAAGGRPRSAAMFWQPPSRTSSTGSQQAPDVGNPRHSGAGASAGSGHGADRLSPDNDPLLNERHPRGQHRFHRGTRDPRLSRKPHP